ncbi:MAG: tetratricopeptide repeat protein [Desulfobaccales bacterium]
MASERYICPRCGGEVSPYAVRCPTCGLHRPQTGHDFRGEPSPEAVTRHLREQVQHRSRVRWYRRLGDLRPLERAFILIQDHPLIAGLVSGVAILLMGFLLLTFPRPFADPLAKAEQLLRQQAERQQAALRQVREAEKAVARRDYAQAFAALGRAMELGADSGRLRYLRGLSALELQRYRDAVRDLSLASGQRPGSPLPWILRGQAFEALGHYQAALTDFRQAVQVLPPQSSDLPRVHLAIARVNERLGDLSQALEALEQALSAGRADAEIYLFSGHLKEQLGLEEAALEDYSRAIQLKPRQAEAYLRRGILQVRLGRYEPAVADLSRALDLGSTAPEAYSHRGVAYAHLGQNEAARRDLETAVRLGAFEARPALKAVANREQALRRLAATRPQVANNPPRKSGPRPSHHRRPRRR